MGQLFLSSREKEVLEATLALLERKYGTEYAYTPSASVSRCSCSGPAQSCTWH